MGKITGYLVDLRKMGLRRTLVDITESCNRFLSWVATLSIMLIMGSVCADIVARNLVNTSLRGVVEVNELAMVAAAFLGLGYAQACKRHISLDLVWKSLPLPLQSIADFAGRTIILGLLAIFLYEAALAAIYSIQIGEYTYGSIPFPLWPSKFALVVGIVGIVAQLVVDVSRSAADAVSQVGRVLRQRFFSAKAP